MQVRYPVNKQAIPECGKNLQGSDPMSIANGIKILKKKKKKLLL